ncbi:MAG: YncE family protein, partial [Gammaproteobacteria bacterium]
MVKQKQLLSSIVYVILSMLVAAPSVATETIIPNNSSYTLFESGQVRPLALSPDGKKLFALNTPDNRLEVFDTTGKSLRHCGSLSVGLEPVALSARNNREVWVVNHLSDSVSIVRIDRQACKKSKHGKYRSRIGHIKRTLLVGDEPRDIVFAGAKHKRAFITTAHRGQNAPYDPQLTTPGIGRADVWVFDERYQGNSLEGNPLNIISLFTNTPRALAVSKDGRKVYAAGFNTGNQTTSLHETIISANGGLPAPHTNIDGIEQPATGLIIKYDGEHWVDETGRVWDEQVKFSLPDKDVFVIDATANPPLAINDDDGIYTGV